MSLDLKEKSFEELDDLRNELEVGVINIKGQIAEAKSQQAVGGEYSDVDWFNRARFALMRDNQQLQQVQRAIGALSMKNPKHKESALLMTFIEVVRNNISQELFIRCMNQAFDEVGQK